MNPIPTTNAMKPAPGKGVPSFPTPVIQDTVIVEVVNAWKGDYIPLEYGAKWNDHPHASQQSSFPDHKLIGQAPTSEDGQWVKRIWANDRVDQDTYNYAIKYSGGSDAHPIYIRTYLEPRETYAPRLDNSPDPLFPGAFLVDEEVTRTEGEFDSRYVQVTRVYETLPGPVIPTRRINERGDLETVNTQVVPPGTQPDPDGLLVTQTQVAQEEVSKGVKTTATVPSHSQLLIKEKKDGLLGETVTTDDIVDPETEPDELSETILNSTVQQTSATKAVKRTTTATGPTELPSLSLVDSPLGLVKANVNKSIVAPETIPENDLKTLQDKIDRIDSAKSERQKVVVEGTWPTIRGAFKDNENGINLPYEETIIDPQTVVWQNRLESFEFDPIDEEKLKVRNYSEEIIDTILSQVQYSYPQEVNVKLPNKLLDVVAYFGLDNGQGNSEGEGAGAGESYSYEFTKSKTTSASATGDIYFKVEKGYEGVVPGTKFIFFSRTQNLSTEAILEILTQKLGTTVREYPNIKMISENLVIIGGSKSKTTRESESSSVSINGSSDSSSSEESYNVGVSANSVIVPETLHEEIQIGIETIGSLGELDVEYQVFPPTLQATNPVKFPIGRFLISLNFDNYRFGWFKVTCIIANIQEKYT
jgi:hypothetical protein